MEEQMTLYYDYYCLRLIFSSLKASIEAHKQNIILYLLSTYYKIENQCVNIKFIIMHLVEKVQHMC